MPHVTYNLLHKCTCFSLVHLSFVTGIPENSEGQRRKKFIRRANTLRWKPSGDNTERRASLDENQEWGCRKKRAREKVKKKTQKNEQCIESKERMPPKTLRYQCSQTWSNGKYLSGLCPGSQHTAPWSLGLSRVVTVSCMPRRLGAKGIQTASWWGLAAGET